MSFRGRFDAKLDGKGRLSLPSAVRAQLEQTEAIDLVITNSQFSGQRCLDLYTASSWQALEEKVARLPGLRAEVQAFQRFYLAGGQGISMDTQGRLLIPQSFRRYAGFENEVVLVGMGEKIEIWDQKMWQELFQDLATHFDSTLAAVAELEVKHTGEKQ